jgi:hypothetical protein
MIRLRPEDLQDENEVARLAAAANMTPAEFHQQFDSIMDQPMWDGAAP